VVAALDDPVVEVRRAAVEALRGSLSGGDWARWPHALFHRDPAVRQAAIAGNRFFPPPDWHLLYLLPDTTCAEQARQRLVQTTVSPAALPLLSDYIARGFLPRRRAREFAARMVWQECWTFLDSQGPARPEEAIAVVLAAVEYLTGEATVATDTTVDSLDDFFDLFWPVKGEEDSESTRVSDAFFDKLPGELRAENGGDWRRVVASLLILGTRHGRWAPGAARVCAEFLPEFLVCPWIDREVRYPAVAALYRVEGHGSYSKYQVRRWLDADVCRHPSGQLDLWAAGGFLHLLPNNPYEHLLEWFDLADVVAAFRANVEHSAAFLGLAGRSPRARALLIRAILSESRPEGGRLLALLARAVPADGLDFLDPLDGRAACEVLEHLLALTVPPARPHAENKTRRLAAVLARKIAAGHVGTFLHLWLARSTPEEDTLALTILGRLARDYDANFLLRTVSQLPAPELVHFLHAANSCAGLPYAWELELAAKLAGHPEEAVRAWAEPRERRRLEIQTEADKEAAPVPAPFKLGLCAQLRSQPDPAAPDLETCLALLASHDPLPEIDAQFARFGSAEPAFVQRLDEEMIRLRVLETDLPLLGHAWLYRWDQHALAFASLCATLGEDLADGMRFLDTLSVPVLRRRCWEALALVLDIWHWRDRPRLDEAWTDGLSRLLVDMLPTPEGDVAAGILVRRQQRAPGSEQVWALVPAVLGRLPELEQSIRDILWPWIDSRGLPVARVAGVVVSLAGGRDDRAKRIGTSTDIDFLAAQAGGSEAALAAEAARRLCVLGGPGERRLAELLAQATPPYHVALLADTVRDWGDETALQQVRALVGWSETLPEVRYRLGVAFYQRGQRDVLLDVKDAVARPGPVGWFDKRDWEWLQAGENMRDLARLLARSPHPHAYQPLVEYLAYQDGPDEEVGQALTAFLEAGTERLRESRLRAARWLYHNGGRDTARPFLLQGEPDTDPLNYPDALEGAVPAEVDAIVKGFLMAGEGETAEQMILALLKADGVDAFSRQEGCSLLLQHSENSDVRQEARKQMRPGLGRAFKLRRLADTFAWGVRVGRELTGKLFTLEMISSEKLGYTRFSENKLYITPLPILRGEMYGREVVQGLILHELGHHMYHRGEEAEAVWKQGEEEKLHPLLNLVADEHLERNLRARRRAYGDQLKLLAAYAFQHTTREFPVERLLGSLQGRAFEVLSTTHLGFARRRNCVALENGRILMAMERAGLSFARFVRALRMGLGNRHNDPKVAEALALFRRGFRRSDMPRLLDIARRLRDIFGREAELLDSFDQEDTMLMDEEELEVKGEGVTNDELQAEVQNALQRRPGDRGEPRRGGRGLNLGPEEDFTPITKVVPMPYDPAQHAAYAQKVARPAQKMRDYLHNLGLGLEPQRFRMRGKSLDRTRLRAVVLRGDPRMLMARELQTHTDLFLAVLIDCSGSMSSENKLERAKLFGALLAEAARGQPGVDLHVYGFTDDVIYDAGRANRCAVHALETSGGNNDAAALWHAAQAARASRRKAKLLVMISDGSPTECSVNALKALVNRLTRRMKICCAQVAVCPLDHVCFPNYIVLDQENQEASVRQFGEVMARLVRQALRG
jgi:hypothetical protein